MYSYTTSYFYVSTPVYIGWGCTGLDPAHYDAVYEINLRLNCLKNEISCSPYQYYTNVQNGGYNLAPGFYDGIVYSTPLASTVTLCASKPDLVGSVINGYITNQNYWAAVTYPSMTAGINALTLFHKTLYGNDLTGSGGLRSASWQLVAWYGNCNTREN